MTSSPPDMSSLTLAPQRTRPSHDAYDQSSAYPDNNRFQHFQTSPAVVPSPGLRRALPSAWLNESQDNGTAVPPDGRSMSPPQTSDISSGGSPSLSNQQALNGQNGLDDDVIPTAIVIKNIPFNVKRETLLDIISSLAIPTPYAFNYHLDPAGQFRGLAFANFRVAADADAVVAALNGFDVQGRKLRVEYKKVLQAGEKERIEREKAIRRMRSMQLEKERQEAQQQQQQQQQQQMMMGGSPMGGGYDESYSPLSSVPPGGNRGGPFGMAIQNPNPFAMPPMPVPQPYIHQPQSAPSPVQAPPLMSSHSSPAVQKSSSAQTELDMNDAATLEIYSRILLFKDDHMRDELAFARSLSPKQRRIVHLVAQKLGVYHYSVGEGEERYAVVTRHQPDRSGGNGGQTDRENGRRTPSAVENGGRVEGRAGPVRHHSTQALNRSFLVASSSPNGGGSMFSNSVSSYNPPTNGSPTTASNSATGGLRAKKSMPDMKTSLYSPTPRLTTRTSSGNMRDSGAGGGGGSSFSNYAALRRQTSGVLPGLGQIFGSHLSSGNLGLTRASVSGAIGDRPLAGLNGHPTEGIPPVPSLPSTPEGGPSSATSAAVMRQPRGPGTASGGNFARRRESAVGPLDRGSGGNHSGLDARTHEPLEI